MIVTGFIILAPHQGNSINLVRNLHFVFAYVLICNGIARIYYAIFGKHRDYREFLLNGKDIRNIVPIVKYYLFLGKHPDTGKYNPLQKAAYLALFFFAFIQTLTGLVLYRPETFHSFAAMMGGLAVARGLHLFLTWLFITIIITHAYLVFSETMDQVKYMLFGAISERK
ncbi:MAG TPA: cytochrome b/b6 domain-containing protein [Desulfobacteria bacterium]|nr:cytochrome b/b6 domain-containing protein [Desulfobacteria bacterium]